MGSSVKELQGHDTWRFPAIDDHTHRRRPSTDLSISTELNKLNRRSVHVPWISQVRGSSERWLPAKKPDASVVVYLSAPPRGEQARRAGIGAIPWYVGSALALEEWPRLLQLSSISILVAAMLLSTAGVFSAGAGLSVGFFSLSLLFFSNYAAWRNNRPGWFIGPHVAMIGTVSCCTITAAIVINLIV